MDRYGTAAVGVLEAIVTLQNVVGLVVATVAALRAVIGLVINAKATLKVISITMLLKVTSTGVLGAAAMTVITVYLAPIVTVTIVLPSHGHGPVSFKNSLFQPPI